MRRKSNWLKATKSFFSLLFIVMYVIITSAITDESHCPLSNGETHVFPTTYRLTYYHGSSGCLGCQSWSQHWGSRSSLGCIFLCLDSVVSVASQWLHGDFGQSCRRKFHL